MVPRVSGKIACARLVEPAQGSLFGGGADLVRQALRQGQTDERYGRVWHLGHVVEVDGYLCGRLGYERRVDVDRWNNEVQDFSRESVDGGAAAPFAIRLSDLVLVYQPRKQDITTVSFVGALRSMLRLKGEGWRIESLAGEGVSFDRWRVTVDIVTRLRFRMERGDLPRPNISGVTRMLDQVRPDISSIEWHADEGLDTDAQLVRELLGQVEAGIGEIVADGRCGSAVNAIRRWNSVVGDESVMTEVDADPGTGQVDMQTLLDQFSTIRT